MKIVSIKYSIWAWLILFACFAGCGVKGNPVDLSTVTDNMPMVSNLKAITSGNDVILEWNLYAKNNSKKKYIAIEKSELGIRGNECKDCPRTFERVGILSIKDIRTEDKESNLLSFTDKKVVKGKIYNYRLMLCDESGMCLEASATEINF